MGDAVVNGRQLSDRMGDLAKHRVGLSGSAKDGDFASSSRLF